MKLLSYRFLCVPFIALTALASACSDDDDDDNGTGGSPARGGTQSQIGGSAGASSGGVVSGGTAGATTAPTAGTAGAELAGAAGEGGVGVAGEAGAGGAEQAGVAGMAAAGVAGVGATAGAAGATTAGAAGLGQTAGTTGVAGNGGQTSAGAGGVGNVGGLRHVSNAGAPPKVTSTNAQLEGDAAFTAGAQPAGGTVAAPAVESPTSVINGAGATYTVTVDSTVEAVLVFVQGDNGYFTVPVTAAAAAAGKQDVQITLLPGFTGVTLNVSFALKFKAGHASSWVQKQITVIQTGTGDVKVSLSFDEIQDLDLHVFDPLGNEVWFDQKTLSYDGVNIAAELDLDANMLCDPSDSGYGKQNENIFWAPGTAPRGTYEVHVFYYQQCTAAPVNYTVTTTVGTGVGADIRTYSGTFQPGQDYATTGTMDVPDHAVVAFTY